MLNSLETSRRLVRNTLALSIAQVAHIGLNTVLSLLIARLRGAEGLGKYAVITAYLQIFQVLITMGAPRLVVREIARQPHCEERARHWFQVMLVNQVLGAGIGVCVLVFLAHVLDHPPLTVRALEVVSLSLLPFAISSAAESVLQAEERMELIALAQMVSWGVQVVGSVIALLVGKDIVALASMLVAKQTVAALIEGWVLRPTGVWRCFRVDLAAAIYLCRAALAFYARSILSTVFSKIDVLFLAQIAGEEAAGIYSAAYLVIQVINYLSVSYSTAAYPVLARLFGEGLDRFRSLLRRSVLFGLLTTLIIAIQIAAVATPIVYLLYGEDYASSASVLRAEAPFVVIFLWNTLISNGLLVSNLQRRSVIVSGVKLGASLIYYPLLIVWLGPVGAALGTLLAGLTAAVLNYYFFSREVCSLGLLGLVAKPLLIGGLVLVGLRAARGISWPGLIAGSTLLYLALLIVFRVVSKEDLLLIRRIVLL